MERLAIVGSKLIEVVCSTCISSKREYPVVRNLSSNMHSEVNKEAMPWHSIER